MIRRRVDYQGQPLDVLELDFEVTSEQWNEYRLLDGGVVRMKTTPLQIWQVLDENGSPAFTQNGDNYIIVNHATHIAHREAS